MSRSIWKPSFLHRQAFESVIVETPSVGKVTNNPKSSSAASEIVLFNRSTYITSSRVGARFQVYNGVRFFPLEITSERVGHLVGEFAPTRKRPVPKKK